MSVVTPPVESSNEDRLYDLAYRSCDTLVSSKSPQDKIFYFALISWWFASCRLHVLEAVTIWLVICVAAWIAACWQLKRQARSVGLPSSDQLRKLYKFTAAVVAINWAPYLLVAISVLIFRPIEATEKPGLYPPVGVIATIVFVNGLTRQFSRWLFRNPPLSRETEPNV